MKVSDKHYAFIMLAMFLAVVGISCAIGGFIGITNPQGTMNGFRVSLTVGMIAISVFHFVKGRK